MIDINTIKWRYRDGGDAEESPWIAIFRGNTNHPTHTAGQVLIWADRPKKEFIVQLRKPRGMTGSVVVWLDDGRFMADWRELGALEAQCLLQEYALPGEVSDAPL